jgi:transcriptional regulator with XRE-family HTH domain
MSAVIAATVRSARNGGNSQLGIATVTASRYNSAVDFSQALRERRVSRRLSQLELALRAGTTQRYLSFLETGRSGPGRDIVIRLAESLELPLRERNDLLVAAGFAPAYLQTSLTDPALAPVRAAIEHVLEAHLPYPAIVVNRCGLLVAANEAFSLLTDGAAADLLEPPVNAYRLALHPRGLAPRVANFPQWARHVVEAVHAALRRDPDDELRALHAELVRYLPDGPADAGPLGFAVPLRLRVDDGQELELMTTITTFATAVDVTIAELRLEAFLPGSQLTADYLAAGPRGADHPRVFELPGQSAAAIMSG